MNSTEEWMVREQLKAGNYKIIRDTGFAELTTLTIELNNGEQYTVETFLEEITDIQKIRDT